jgi:hypothetical protein
MLSLSDGGGGSRRTLIEARPLHSHPRHCAAGPRPAAPQPIVQLKAAAAASCRAAKTEPNVGRRHRGRPTSAEIGPEAGPRATTQQVRAMIQTQEVEAAAAEGGGREAEAAGVREGEEVEGGLGAAGAGAAQLVGYEVEEGDQLIRRRLVDPPARTGSRASHYHDYDASKE